MRALTKPRVLHLALALSLLWLGGCQGWDPGWWSWFDPSQTVRTPQQSLMNPIFSQLGPADQTQELVPGASKPAPPDLEYRQTDYVLGPSDILRVSIMDLFMEGQEYLTERQVTDSGYIDLPLLPASIKAAGLTQEQLTKLIKEGYVSADILKTPAVAITVTGPRQNIFSILGAIGRPGTYQIPQKKFTLLEALAMAGDISQTNLEVLYVVRQEQPGAGAVAAPPAPAPGPEELPPLPTFPRAVPPATQTRPGATGPTTDKSIEEQLEDLEKFIPGAGLRPRQDRAPGRGFDEPILLSSVGSGMPAATGSSAAAAGGKDQGDLEQSNRTYKWVYSGGQFIRVEQTTTAAGEPALPARTPGAPEDPYGWSEFELRPNVRIIAIDLVKLKANNPRMNVIIRNGDIIQVPTLEVGEFYVLGEVYRPGAYSLTGRRVTLKMAIAAAGNFGALSWPDNSVLIRRIGRDQEQMIAVHLNEVFAGREPDVFLKPDDVIAVGSHWSAPFLAVWRNAFRMTYGFGFIYDRNYSERDFEIPLLNPSSGFRMVRH